MLVSVINILYYTFDSKDTIDDDKVQILTWNSHHQLKLGYLSTTVLNYVQGSHGSWKTWKVQEFY